MSVQEVIARLTEAKKKLQSARSTAAAAAESAAEAEQHVVRALEGAGGNQVVAQITDAKTSLAEGLAKLGAAEAEVDRAIQRAHAIGGGHY